MAELDIAEKRVPQDGRFRVKIRGRSVDFRVSIMPSAHGEDAVIRILDKESMNKEFKNLRLDVLGFDDDLVGFGEIFFDLLEFAMLFDDTLEFGVLLGEFLETCGIVHDLWGGEFAGHFLVAGVELIELVAEGKYGHFRNPLLYEH